MRRASDNGAGDSAAQPNGPCLGSAHGADFRVRVLSLALIVGGVGWCVLIFAKLL